jgi:predicted fused transcriptional regulator/phosphomethylpyrimidine kinase
MTDVEFGNIVYSKPSIVKACKDELLELIRSARLEGTVNYRNALQALIDARQADADVEMDNADNGAESDATIVGVKPSALVLEKPSTTLWGNNASE